MKIACAYRELIEARTVSANPRPWRLLFRYDAKGQMTAIEIQDCAGGVVEHRMSSGFHPRDFARHVANAEVYLAAVNGEPVSLPVLCLDLEEAR